jgi:hypothetical protein
MSDNNNNNDNDAEDFKKKLQALKPKKKKLAVPEGFLDGAKSYEGKVEAVKIISEREKDRVVLIFKKMIAQGREDVIRIEREKEAAKKADNDKAEAEKKRKLEAEKKAKGSMLSKLKGKK